MTLHTALHRVLSLHVQMVVQRRRQATYLSPPSISTRLLTVLAIQSLRSWTAERRPQCGFATPDGLDARPRNRLEMATPPLRGSPGPIPSAPRRGIQLCWLRSRPLRLWPDLVLADARILSSLCESCDPKLDAPTRFACWGLGGLRPPTLTARWGSLTTSASTPPHPSRQLLSLRDRPTDSGFVTLAAGVIFARRVFRVGSPSTALALRGFVLNTLRPPLAAPALHAPDHQQVGFYRENADLNEG